VGDLYRGSLVSSQFNQHRSRVDPTQTMQSCTSIECVGHIVIDIDTTIKCCVRMGANPWHSRDHPSDGDRVSHHPSGEDPLALTQGMRGSAPCDTRPSPRWVRTILPGSQIRVLGRETHEWGSQWSPHFPAKLLHIEL